MKKVYIIIPYHSLELRIKVCVHAKLKPIVVWFAAALDHTLYIALP